MLDLLNVHKKFLKFNLLTAKEINHTHVIKGIDFKAKPGDSIGIVGKNGSGKSTLIKMLFGSLLPDDGSIEFNGSQELFRNNTKYFSLFGNNERSFFWRLSVRDNLEYFNSLSGRNNMDRVDELIEKLNFSKLIDKPFFSLSSGEKKLAMLIRGLIKNPTVLFFDEFTQSLDLKNKIVIKDVLTDIKKENEKIIFWVTHDLNELKNICNRVMFIKNGQINYCNNDFSGSETDIAKFENLLLDE